MARAERPRAKCPICPKEGALTDEGVMRYHLADDPEHQDTSGSRKCRGAGQPPAGAQAVDPEAGDYVCRVPAGPTGCGKVVQLTANNRARTHLNPQSERCPGGSDWPLFVNANGTRVDTRPHGTVYPGVAPEDLLMEDESEPVRQLRLAGAFDPRDPEGPGEAPGGAFVAELKTEVGDPGTVARQLAAYQGKSMSQLTREAIELFSRRTPEEKLETARRMDARASAALGLPLDPDLWGPEEKSIADAAGPPPCTCTTSPGDLEGPAEDCPAHGNPAVLFDETHRYDDGAGGVWVHPGNRLSCRLPDCCTHPRGFDYGDDGKGHSGSFCFLCGVGEPDPCPPHELESVTVDGRPVARCSKCWKPWAEAEQENASSWKTPADELALMPEGIRRMAESNPECWDCTHEISPVVESFDPYGKPEVVVWNCWDTCYNSRGLSGHAGHWCRPQLPEEDLLRNLERGDYFRRHTLKRPLDNLVYRVDVAAVTEDIVSAIVVSPGRFQGQTGELTNLQEEITCTSHEGTRRPRRGLDTSATSRSKPQPNPLPATPSPQASPTPSRTPGRSSTPVTPASASTAPSPSTRATSSAPSAATSTSTASATTTGAPVPDAFSTAKQASKESDRYDRYGRYKMLHPVTGKKVNWTRATTYAKSVQDTFALSQWAQRMTLKGASLRPDIVAAVSTLDVKEDKDRVNTLVEDAKKAAGDKVAANLGTAIHAFTEDRDKVLVGMPVEAREIPAKLQPSVDAYDALLASFGLMPVPGLIEFSTGVVQYEIAGTSDRCYKVTRDITFKLHGRTVTLYAGEYVIGDVKTGADLSYGWMEIAIQLAIYAQGLNTSGVWSWDTLSWGYPMSPDNPEVQIKVRTDVGLIPHLPVDRKPGAPLATLFAVDLDFGWATAVLCGQVRSARKEGNIATPLSVADVDEAPAGAPVQAPVARPAVASRPATLEDKARAVTTQEGASAVWKEAVAARTPKAEVDRLVTLMKAKLESHVEQGA